jgi:hypothetical protein
MQVIKGIVRVEGTHATGMLGGLARTMILRDAEEGREQAAPGFIFRDSRQDRWANDLVSTNRSQSKELAP